MKHRGARAEITASNSPAVQHVAQSSPLRNGLHIHIGRVRLGDEVERRHIPVRSPDNPAALFWAPSVFIPEDAFGPDAGIVAVHAEFADDFPRKIVGALDTAVNVDEYGRVTKRSGQKDR